MLSAVRVFAIALLAMPAAAFAQTASYDAAYARYQPSERAVQAITAPALSQCMRRSGGITVNVRECYFAEQDHADALLNANYGRTMARLNQSRRQGLRASQRRWLTNRYARCDANMEQGTLALIERDGCVLAEIQRRALWLTTL
jgi:uncharacterized protein YecT (DUF1311 family)